MIMVSVNPIHNVLQQRPKPFLIVLHTANDRFTHVSTGHFPFDSEDAMPGIGHL